MATTTPWRLFSYLLIGLSEGVIVGTRPLKEKGRKEKVMKDRDGKRNKGRPIKMKEI